MDITGMREVSSDTDYGRAVDLYGRGLYAAAAGEFERLAGREDAMGRMARFYYALCRRAMGIEALRESRFGDAERHLRAAVAAAGRRCDLSAYLAELYAKTHRHQQCAGVMEKLADSSPASAEAQRRLAQAQWRAGRREQAYMTLTAAMRQLDDCAGLHVQLGLFYAAEERFDEARAALGRAVEADCANPDAHYYLAMAAAGQGDAPAAVKSLQRSLELRPDDLLVAYQLALAARASGESGFHVVVRPPEPARAETGNGSQIRQLAEYVTIESDFVDAFLALPPSQADEDLFGMLGGVLQMALAEHPRYADLHLRCSRVLGRLGKVAAAIEHAERAVQINPRYVDGLLQLAGLTASAGREAEAVELLQRAVDAGADWPDVHYQAGRLMKALGRSSHAARHLRRALQLNGSYARAAEELASLAA